MSGRWRRPPRHVVTSRRGVRLPQTNAAAGATRLKAGLKPCRAQTLQDTHQQMQVHAADQLGPLLGKGVGRAAETSAETSGQTSAETSADPSTVTSRAARPRVSECIPGAMTYILTPRSLLTRLRSIF